MTTPDKYTEIKEALGFKGDFNLYDFSITIISPSYSEFEYGASYQHAKSVVSVTRNVLIYHPPSYPAVLPGYLNPIAPFYEGGQITVMLFLGGYI